MKSNLFLLCGILPLFFDMRYPADKHGDETKLKPNDTIGVSFFDDFSQGLLGHWLGDVPSFYTPEHRLSLIEGTAVPAMLSVPSPRIRNTLWEAGIQVDGIFSTSNYIRLYLASTRSSPGGQQQGYHLQIDGMDGSHTYCLWRQHGSARSIVFQSEVRPNQGTHFRARIRVTCSEDGYWQILADEEGHGAFIAIPDEDGRTDAQDVTYSTAGYAGYFVNCSPTRWRDFKLDYLLIKPFDPALDSASRDVPQPGDILINEILSNPKPGGVDFVEIYNHSTKTIDLQHVYLAQVNSAGMAGSRRKITEQFHFLHPGEYRVLTTRPAVLKQHYPNGNSLTFVEMPELPNFNNETGGVVLYSEGIAIDSLFYTPAMQSPFTTNHRGISLERQQFSLPAHAPDNFRSAATSIGATPGYRNSRYAAEPAGEGFFLTSKTFSPDGDGFEDQLEINYIFPESDLMANIDIYDDGGRLVKRLLRNQHIATQGTFTWDGLADANQRLPVGLYVAVIEVYNAQGVRKIYRKGFALATRL